MRRRDFLKYSLLAAAAARPMMVDATPSSPLALSHLDRLTGHVVLPGQPEYDAAREGFNGRLSHFPAAIVFCRSPHDVVHAIDWARNTGTLLRARSGRHCYEGFSNVDNGLVVDVSPMRHLHIDHRRQTIHVGAGANLLELYEALWEHRLTVPGGSCATVGIAGLTLGGGYGLLARALGLTCDNLLAVEIVTASGQTIHADARRHSDLFWACRGGGGGNFGIVTAFTFRTHPIDQVAIYNITWDFGDLEAVLAAWQPWAVGADPRLTGILKLRAQSFGTIASTGQFLGTADEMTALLKPLAAVGTPREVSVETVPYMDAVHIFAGLKPDYAHWRLDWHAPHTAFKNSSDYVSRPLPAEALRTIRHFLETAPADGNLLQMEAYGGAISRISPDATAFAHRASSLLSLQYQSYWNRPEAEADNRAWVQAFRQNMRPFVSGGAYSNYCDIDIADWPRAYYGANLARLRQIKARYDPQDLFQFPQEIRTNHSKG